MSVFDSWEDMSREELTYFEGILLGIYGNWLIGFWNEITFPLNPLWNYILRIILFGSSVGTFILFFLVGHKIEDKRFYMVFIIGHIFSLFFLKWPYNNIVELINFSFVGYLFWLLLVMTKIIRDRKIKQED